MNLLQDFQQFISKENLFSTKDTLLLAVSGGIDSVVLCELCKQAGYDFIIAHCNFQLRGAESNRDEEFVKDLGTKYNKQVLVKHFKTDQYAAEKKVSIQVAARELRYAWFLSIVDSRETRVGSRESIVDSQKAVVDSREPIVDSQETVVNDRESIVDSQKAVGDSRESIVDSQETSSSGLKTNDSRLPTFLLTAHHLDDNIETMLMNFFKGTGIAGLRAMLPKQGKIVRPLLFATKESIKNFAEENKLGWVEDSSNQSDKYARNYFRNQLIPLVKNLYPAAEHNLANNLDRFKEIELLYHQSIDQHKKKLLEYKGNEVHIPVLKLQKTVPLHSVVYEIIKDYHFNTNQTEEVIALLKSETGRFVQSATHRIFKNRNWLIISPNQLSEADHILIEEPGKVELVIGNLELGLLDELPENISVSSNIALLDAASIKFPLLLRKWKTGDYFYPLGMKKKKKLARFFIDQKLSKTQKENVWVIEMNKKIIWVVGHRIDDRFKITRSTKQVLQIKSEAVNV